MAQLSDAIVISGLSGSVPWSVHVLGLWPATSASHTEVFHPGGQMTASMLLLPENKNRIDLSWKVVGLPLKFSFGAPLPRGQYSIASNFQLNAARGSMGVGFCYTGPIYGIWDENVAASASFVVLSELTGT